MASLHLSNEIMSIQIFPLLNIVETKHGFDGFWTFNIPIIILLRNKHAALLRRLWAVESFLVCAAMMGDSSTVTVARRCSHKDKPGAAYRKSRLRGLEKPRSGFAIHPEERIILNRTHHRERLLF
ncbi:hypothetical protein Zmor_005366 [Zophobas morio]|uniref:Uncharacterized protein n=1 Tax=Zophobas morio TaxID=2755281 RepID=A0AA38IS27_9CUCU|nr:hypothetical protein Zmor_005366 [Zophobas morio]